MSKHIEKRIEIKAPIAKVWQAISDHRQFGEWFRVALEGPFAVGQKARGHILHPGYEHLVWEATVTQIVPEKLLAFTWHPYAVDPKKDYSQETPTLVEFRLERVPNGTQLTVVESGFDKIPSERREEAMRMNDRGWTEQMVNVQRHVEK